MGIVKEEARLGTVPQTLELIVPEMTSGEGVNGLFFDIPESDNIDSDGFFTSDGGKNDRLIMATCIGCIFNDSSCFPRALIQDQRGVITNGCDDQFPRGCPIIKRGQPTGAPLWRSQHT